MTATPESGKAQIRQRRNPRNGTVSQLMHEEVWGARNRVGHGQAGDGRLAAENQAGKEHRAVLSRLGRLCHHHDNLRTQTLYCSYVIDLLPMQDLKRHGIAQDTANLVRIYGLIRYDHTHVFRVCHLRIGVHEAPFSLCGGWRIYKANYPEKTGHHRYAPCPMNALPLLIHASTIVGMH